MSARIGKGDTVRCTHGEPDDGLFAGRNYEVKEIYASSAYDAYIDVGVAPDGWNLSRFEKVERPVRVVEDEAVADVVGPNAVLFVPDGAFDATEPEDKADLYVEPEPLKEGDWAQIWVMVLKPDLIGEVWKVALDGEASKEAYVRSDAIVRPDAGQVPPWLKPAQCTSLTLTTSLTSFWRCDKNEHGDDEPHKSMTGERWTTEQEVGRITESGAS
jgi:hypothetical protein